MKQLPTSKHTTRSANPLWEAVLGSFPHKQPALHPPGECGECDKCWRKLRRALAAHPPKSTPPRKGWLDS